MQMDRRHFCGAALSFAAAAATISKLDTSPAIAAPAGVSDAVPPPRFGTPQMVPASPVLVDEPLLLRRARAALDQHSGWVPNRDRIALVDFSLPSREARMQLLNLESGKVEQTWLVAHGRGSDPANSGFARRFSNVPSSNASSLGAFLTANDYYGAHGHSRRVIGMDPENNRAWDRAIVIHAAPYVDSSMARNQGRIGRSLGCFAVEPSAIGEVLERLGPGRLLFAGN